MSCKHTVVQAFGAMSWCTHCGAVRVDPPLTLPRQPSTFLWQLPAHEQAEVLQEEMCPICEFGEPRPVEIAGDRKIWRWTCGHWIDSAQHAKPIPVPLAPSDVEGDHAVNCTYRSGGDCDCNWEGERSRAAPGTEWVGGVLVTRTHET
jgi:hypothetical protein